MTTALPQALGVFYVVKRLTGGLPDYLPRDLRKQIGSIMVDNRGASLAAEHPIVAVTVTVSARMQGWKGHLICLYAFKGSKLNIFLYMLLKHFVTELISNPRGLILLHLQIRFADAAGQLESAAGGRWSAPSRWAR